MEFISSGCFVFPQHSWCAFFEGRSCRVEKLCGFQGWGMERGAGGFGCMRAGGQEINDSVFPLRDIGSTGQARAGEP